VPVLLAIQIWHAADRPWLILPLELVELAAWRDLLAAEDPSQDGYPFHSADVSLERTPMTLCSRASWRGALRVGASQSDREPLPPARKHVELAHLLRGRVWMNDVNNVSSACRPA